VVERDKNRPSVVAWSLGNEAGNGDAFQRGHSWLKRRDRSRPVQCVRRLAMHQPIWNEHRGPPCVPVPNFIIKNLHACL